MAAEVCRAFETAGVEPPAELKTLWEKFRDQMAEQGIVVHAGGGGFSGSGFKYDDTENETEANKRKLTKLMHGMESGGGGGGDDEEEDIEQQLTSIMKTKSRVVNRGSGGGDGDGSTPRQTRAEIQAHQNKIAEAKARAEAIAAAKRLNATPIVEKDATAITAEAVMKGEEAQPLNLSVSKQIFYVAHSHKTRLAHIFFRLPPLQSKQPKG